MFVSDSLHKRKDFLMKFEVKHSTNHYLRLRIAKREFTDNEAFNIKQLLFDNENLDLFFQIS